MKRSFYSILFLFFSGYSLAGVLKVNNQENQSGKALVTKAHSPTFGMASTLIPVYLFPQKTTTVDIEGPITSISWGQSTANRWKANITRTFAKSDSDSAELIIYPNGEYEWKSSLHTVAKREKAQALS